MGEREKREWETKEYKKRTNQELRRRLREGLPDKTGKVAVIPCLKCGNPFKSQDRVCMRLCQNRHRIDAIKRQVGGLR